MKLNPDMLTRTRRGVALLVSLLVFPFGIAKADKVLTGEATFYAESHHSMDDCREGALQLARVEALAVEYGRTIGQETVSIDAATRSGEENFFQSLSTTEVRGEWISDEGDPKFDISLGKDGLYVVKCVVRGKTRPLSNDAPEFKAVVLRNGDTDRFADTRFKSGDNLRVLFKAPMDGYAAAYLACADGMVYTLLPYISDNSGNVKVKGGKEYVFFSPACTDLGDVDQYQLQTDLSVERNHLYVLYSPNEFTKALDGASGGMAPRSLSFKDFSKWVSSKRSRDPKMGLKMVPITIENNL